MSTACAANSALILVFMPRMPRHIVMPYLRQVTLVELLAAFGAGLEVLTLICGIAAQARSWGHWHALTLRQLANHLAVVLPAHPFAVRIGLAEHLALVSEMVAVVAGISRHTH